MNYSRVWIWLCLAELKKRLVSGSVQIYWVSCGSHSHRNEGMKVDKCKPRVTLLCIFTFVIPEGLVVFFFMWCCFMSHSLNQMRGLAWPLQEGPIDRQRITGGVWHEAEGLLC